MRKLCDPQQPGRGDELSFDIDMQQPAVMHLATSPESMRSAIHRYEEGLDGSLLDVAELRNANSTIVPGSVIRIYRLAERDLAKGRPAVIQFIATESSSEFTAPGTHTGNFRYQSYYIFEDYDSPMTVEADGTIKLWGQGRTDHKNRVVQECLTAVEPGEEVIVYAVLPVSDEHQRIQDGIIEQVQAQLARV